MKKLILLFLINLTVYGQDIIKEMDVPGNHYIISTNYSKNGSVIIKTNKFSLNPKGSKPNIFNYDSQLNLRYKIQPDYKFSFIDCSDDGGKVLFNKSFFSDSTKKYNLLDEKGEAKFYDGNEWLPKNFVLNDFFMTSNEHISIGYEKNRKDIKKNKSGTYQLFKRDLNNFKSLGVTEFLLPKFDVKGDYKLISHGKDDFTIFTKDVLELRNQKYIIAKYSNDGTLLKSTVLDSNLNSSDIYLADVNLNSHSYEIIQGVNGSGKSRISYKPTVYAYGDVFIDDEDSSFYTYSIFTSRKSKFGSGFIIKKYDVSGKLIWESKHEFFSKKTHKEIEGDDTLVHLVNTNNGLGLSVSNSKDDYAFIYNLDKKDGKIIDSKTYYELNRIDPVNFFYTLKDSYSKKVLLDPMAVILSATSQKVHDYLKSFSESKSKKYFKGLIVNDGVILVQIDDTKKRTFKILKFYW